MKPAKMTRPLTTDLAGLPTAPKPRSGPGTNGRSRRTTKPAEEENRPITPMGLIHALRRRWIPAVAVAIPAALFAGVALWELVPAPYESYAMVKVAQYTQDMIGRAVNNESNFLNYRDSQMAYIRSRVVLEAALRKPEVAQTETIKGLTHPVEYLAKQLKVDAMESDEFVRIALHGDKPRELATIVNAIKDSYMNEVVFAERNKKIAKLEKLESVLAEKEEQLEEKRKSIDALALALGTVDARIANMTIARAEQNLAGLGSDRRKVRSSLLDEEVRRNARIQAGLPPDSLVSTGEPGGNATGVSPAAVSAAQNILRLKDLIARYEETTVPGRPNTKLEKYRRDLKKLLAEQGGGEDPTGVRLSRYEYLKQELEHIESEIAAAEKLVAENGRKAVQLERENENIKALIETQSRLKQEVSNLGIEILAPTRVEVVHDANIPEVKNMKTRTRLAALGAVGMFALVVAGFTLLEWMAQRIASPSELASETGMRLLGSLPAPERPGMLGKLGFGDPNLSEWNRVLVESVDVVRTYLLRHLNVEGPQAIVIASASANEGKTTLSTQLGSSIARSGRRVCVVDCDFRRPSAHLVFQTEQGMGVSELLRSEADVETITRETSIPGLFFISAGQVDDESIRVLALDGGENLLETLKKHFDFVIVDTSPILFVAEPSMIAQHSDAVVVAVRRDYSRLSFVNQACETLRNLEAPLVGTVMVGAESSIHRQTYGYQQDIRFAEPQQKRTSSRQKTAV